MKETALQCEVLVAGGGPAGFCCALAAARNGAKVILCQDRPMLGGNASSEIRMHIVGADGSGYRGAALSTEARETGIIEEIRLDMAVQNPQRSNSMLDLCLYDKCRAEPNLTLMLNTTVVGAVREGDRITQAFADRQSTEERFRIDAKVFIDCTGDGRLGMEAGAAYRHGREAQNEYNETLAPDKADAKTLGSTLLFQARRHDKPMPFVAPTWARKFTEQDLRLRPHATPDLDRGLEYGYWWVELGGCVDTIADNEAIRDDLLAVVMGVWDHIKNGGEHSATNWALDWFGFVPGKRESRRFIGQYVLNEIDLLEARQFPDAIAYGGWPIDIHPPEGVDAPNEEPCTQHHLPHLYDVPLRACVSRDVSNLMFAGRNISATHVAFASTRVMATCGVIGQGVGTAAAYAFKHGLSPTALASDEKAIGAIQQTLLRQDCYLIGRPNADSRDLARSAHASASSEQPEGPAAAVIDGFTRTLTGPRGNAPGREPAGTHRWMSDPADALPAWIELTWPQAIHASQIEVTFDTGLHRILTLSMADAYTAKMDWGKPQIETARDYQIDLFMGLKLVDQVSVESNHQRHRVHHLAHGVSCDRIRLTVEVTNGLDHARVVSVRVY